MLDRVYSIEDIIRACFWQGLVYLNLFTPKQTQSTKSVKSYQRLTNANNYFKQPHPMGLSYSLESKLSLSQILSESPELTNRSKPIGLLQLNRDSRN